MVLAACADDRTPGVPSPSPLPVLAIDGTWVAMGSFTTGVTSGNYDITLVLDETNGTIAAATRGQNDITVMLSQPSSTVLSYSTEGDPSFITGNLTGNQIALTSSFAGRVAESLEITINGALDTTATRIRGGLSLEFLDLSVNTPITLVKLL
jgi:hypothetical protein